MTKKYDRPSDDKAPRGFWISAGLVSDYVRIENRTQPLVKWRAPIRRPLVRNSQGKLLDSPIVRLRQRLAQLQVEFGMLYSPWVEVRSYPGIERI